MFMRVPFYEKVKYPRFTVASNTQVHMMEIVDFLKWVLNRDQLEIADYLNEMGQDPFFLVAATGLGKTVGVPVHMLIRQIQATGSRPNPQPRVWIVEPRIPIAVGQAAFMNMLWKDFSFSKGNKNVPPLFGCITSTSGNVNPEAPIKFVTTGIFELMAGDGQLSPSRDRVVIDEAHVTIEQNPGVELGIALARKAGITVDYMSATVDTTGLGESLGIANIINADKQRFVVWKHNLLNMASKSLAEVVARTLVTPDLSSRYFPQPQDFEQAALICAAVTEPGRSHGMLVVVNSFAGEFSDTQRLAKILQKEHPSIPVLQLASEVIRNPQRMREYEKALQQIEANKQNYVILATSVVEMGVTFPTLDFVVTMDSGYDQQTIGNVTFPVEAPLGVNSLLQRIGRVGRKRPGIAYITTEIGADYAAMEDDELNDKRTLVYEPITFPLADSPLMPLAYYACKKEWYDISMQITDLNLPSALHESPERMEYLQQQIDMLEVLGLASGNKLTPLGKTMEKWIGQADLAYAVQLQKCLEEGADFIDIVFWVVATALSNTPIATLRIPNGYFVDYESKHGALLHGMDVWSHSIQHEDVSAFRMLAVTAHFDPVAVFGYHSLLGGTYDELEFRRWCGASGINSRKLLQAVKAIRETWKLFQRINSASPEYKKRFSEGSLGNLAMIPWTRLMDIFFAGDGWKKLYELPGVSPVRFSFDETTSMFTWAEQEGDYRGGILSQDDTPILLEEGVDYVARLIPSRRTKDSSVTWRLAHLGR